MSRNAKKATFRPGTTRMKALGSHEWLMYSAPEPLTEPSIVQ